MTSGNCCCIEECIISFPFTVFWKFLQEFLNVFIAYHTLLKLKVTKGCYSRTCGEKMDPNGTRGDIPTWKWGWGALWEDLSELRLFSIRIGGNLSPRFFSAAMANDHMTCDTSSSSSWQCFVMEGTILFRRILVDFI